MKRPSKLNFLRGLALDFHVRMARPPFKNIPKKGICRKAAKKVGTKPGTGRRLMRAMDEFAAEMAADRPAHFSRFIKTWRAAAAGVDALADALMLHPRLVIPKDAVKLALAPYSLESLFLFHPLAGVLTYAEEFEFVETDKALVNAWNKFFAVVAARPKVAAHDLAQLRTAVAHLDPRVANIYQGVANPEPDPKWVIALDDAEKSFTRITEGLAS